MAVPAQSPGYIFGGSTGITYDDLQRRRQLLDAMEARRASRTPQNIEEGLNALGEGILAGIEGRQLRKDEERARTAQAGIWSDLSAATSMTPASAGAGYGTTTGAIADASPTPTGAASAAADLSGDKGAFVSALMPAALEASQRTGVDPRIIVAQAAQETGWGRSAPGNNYFGIKSHGQDGGQDLATHEVVNGQRVKVNDSFRTFDSPGNSVAGYADFLLENPRYKPMMAAQGLDAQLEALGASGYATDPSYSRSVGAIARSLPMPTNAAQAIEQQAPQQAPVQVASLDPSAGVAQAMQPQPANVPVPTSRQALERAFQAQAAQGVPGSTPAPDDLSGFRQNPVSGVPERDQPSQPMPAQQVSSSPTVGASAQREPTAFDRVAGPALGGNNGAL